MGNVDMLLWIPLLPLLGAAFNLLFGRSLSKKVVHTVAIGAVVGAFAITVAMVTGPLWEMFQAWRAGKEGATAALSQDVYTWIQSGPLDISFALGMDTLSAVMVLTITFVGSLIHIYSMGYMSEEPRYSTYFGYLNLFTGAMLILVLGKNLPVMFIGWEGVGLCSYLLIGFWFEKTEYANAGRKAFVVNRIGDFAFILGMFILFWHVGSVSFDSLRTEGSIELFESSLWMGERAAFFAGLLLFIGACGKSAQIPLYVWLPDAMAGPTPVSALIHAATMVTAGVYMIARLSFLYMSSSTAMVIVCTVGVLTALVAAFMAFAQTDLKKVLAYSTVSQLGFMFAAVGAGAYVAGVFHLVTHAFFKAGLFLGAGSVMHAMSGSGDITKMGGLRKLLPKTHITFLIFCLAIAGIVPFSGFFSKDEILAGLFNAHGENWLPHYGKFLWFLLSLAALGTAFYMFRLYFLVFAGECRADAETKSHIHESPNSMTIPLLVLAACTCVIGFLGWPHVDWLHLPNLFGEWLSPAIDYLSNGKPSALADYPHGTLVNGELKVDHGSSNMITVLMAVALGLGIIGIMIAKTMYGNGPSKIADEFTKKGTGAKLFDLSKNKLYVDEIYEKVIIGPFRTVAKGTFEFIDRFVIDTVFVNGTALVTNLFGQGARLLQNGRVQRYIAGLVVGGALVLFFTHQSDQPRIKYEWQDKNLVKLTAWPGSGPEAQHATFKWDLNDDERPDAGIPENKREIVHPFDPAVEHRVRVWMQEPISGDSKMTEIVIPKRVVAAKAGGAK